MSESEVVSTLLHQAKIEPGFTELGNFKFYLRLPIILSCNFYYILWRAMLIII